MKHYYIATAIAVLSLVSCYDEPALLAEPGQPRYIIEDSTDPLDHAIYEIYRETGVHILYEYQLNDYLWDLGSLRNSSNRLTAQGDRAVLLDGIAYLDKILFGIYPDSFKRSFFPIKIFLADSIDLAGTSSKEDLISASGREYIAIGRLRAGAIPSTAAELREATGTINAYLWANIIIKNRLLLLPETFAELSNAFYGQNYRYVKSQQQGVAIANIPYPTREQLMDEGFWNIDPNNTLNLPIPTSYAMMPTYEGDIYQFIETIITHDEAELLAIMEGHLKIKTKYDILLQAIKEQCGIDLQAIGNK
ncbi:MAG: hypothetical protein LBD64_07595 [Odoribacteraceae bacterium]|jgi:hypothetical protein|nr:hypothetical protein [Odoribacteraceae bacterium]